MLQQVKAAVSQTYRVETDIVVIAFNISKVPVEKTSCRQYIGKAVSLRN